MEESDYQFNTLTLSNEQRNTLFIKINNFITRLQAKNSDAIKAGQSDNTGFFTVGPLALAPNQKNDLLIMVDYEGSWDFRIRPVWSQFYGGVIYQDSFVHSYAAAGSTNTLPDRFSPEATISFKANPVQANPVYDDARFGGMWSAYGNTYVNKNQEQRSEYSYSIVEITKTDFEVERWAQIGQSGYVWVDIEDFNISYLFPWEFISAKMFKAEEEDDPNEGGGTDATTSDPKCSGDPDSGSHVELELVYPEAGAEVRKSIPPAALILKAKGAKSRSFFRSEWHLKISFKYQTVSNEDPTTDDSEEIEKELIFPAEFNETVRFIPNPFSINASVAGGPGQASGSISNVRDKTVGVLGKFVDFEGRLQAVFATKLLTQVTELSCRNVEIRYGYTIPTEEYALQPEGGQTTSITADKLKGIGSLGYSPPCGDHKLSFNGYGYLWYPFADCSLVEYYSIYTGAGSCLNPYPGNDDEDEDNHNRDDYRFCGPIQYVPSTGPVGNWAASCNAKWKYYYSKGADFSGAGEFTGQANIVATVNELAYKSHEPAWDMPPFGNLGREIITRFFSQDYRKHLSNKGSTKPYLRGQWMPLVMDNKMFDVSFNPVEGQAHSPDAFAFVNQLNFQMASDIAEEMEESTRYRFDEVLKINKEPFCSYPEQVIMKGNSTYVVLFNFQHEDTAWVWQEHWKDVERGAGLGEAATTTAPENLISKPWMDFVALEKPDYRWSKDKEEHRLITKEADVDITYTAPEMEEGETGSDALKKWPSIQLGGGPKRYFKILYTDYAGQQVEWMDEGSGEVGGSGGPVEEGSAYQEAMGDEWAHHEDTLFEEGFETETAAAENAGRKIVEDYDIFGKEEVKYYNRGLICSILRSNLKYLPVTAENTPAVFNASTPAQASFGGFPSVFLWDTPVTTDIQITYSVAEEPVCLTYAKIEGVYGRAEVTNPSTRKEETFYACKPDIEITVRVGNDDIVLGTREGFIYEGKLKQKLFEVEFFFPPEVTRLLDQRTNMITVVLRSKIGKEATDKVQSVCINKVMFMHSNWKDLTETVKVWERKYVRSTADIPEPNLDGPQGVIAFEPNNDNSGQYFPSTYPQYHDKLDLHNKVRQVYADPYHDYDERIEVTKDSLMTVEQEKQRILYETAMELDKGFPVSYSATLSPSLKAVLPSGNDEGLTAVFSAEALPYESTNEFNLYVEGEFWQPKGHKFKWGDQAIQMNCWYFGPTETVYDAEFVHMDTDEASAISDPATAMYTDRMEFQLKLAFGDYKLDKDSQATTTVKPEADVQTGLGGGF
ncbi:hypothetical protein DRQ25_09790 [Candidatus Fermentibacteria bacterium]|nr:MAG: hypothetical protein DRQ25_09790 [Candidatus Fermentibacteria bacterium]